MNCNKSRSNQCIFLYLSVCSNKQVAFKCVGDTCIKQTCGPANMSAACFNNPCKCPKTLFDALTAGTVKPCPGKA